MRQGLGVIFQLPSAMHLTDDGWLGIWQRMECDMCRAAVQDDRLQAINPATHVQTMMLGDPATKLDALGTVVVACNENHRNTRPGDQFLKDVAEQIHCVGRRDSSVVDIASDHDGIDFRGTGEIQKLREDMGLVFKQGSPVEEATEMPISGMEKAHA